MFLVFLRFYLLNLNPEPLAIQPFRDAETYADITLLAKPPVTPFAKLTATSAPVFNVIVIVYPCHLSALSLRFLAWVGLAFERTVLSPFTMILSSELGPEFHRLVYMVQVPCHTDRAILAVMLRFSHHNVLMLRAFLVYHSNNINNITYI